LLLALDAAMQAAELDQARASLGLAQANQQRNQDLFARKFISQQALDNTQAALKVQEAALALAQAKFDKTRIRRRSRASSAFATSVSATTSRKGRSW
jgi:membrane fusion protein (multidrug efflux system)